MVGSKLVFSANPTPGRREYALFRGQEELLRMDFHLSGSASHVTVEKNGNKTKQKLTANEARRSTQFFLLWAMSNAVVVSDEDIELVGIKVAVPGRYFQDTRSLTDAYMNKLLSIKDSSPSHATAAIEDIRQIRKSIPNAKIIAVSDSVFHQSAQAMSTYALPKKVTKKYDLMRFGYRGTSTSSVVKQLGMVAGKVYDRTVVCELGPATTVTALHKGRSVYTSSGYSPAGGLPSTHGSGDIDPNALLTIFSKSRLSPVQLRSYFSNSSGLAGMSGTSGSFNKLFDLSSQAHEASAKALKLINESVKREIASATAMLNGLDMLVITGEAGLDNPKLRKLILSNLDFLGIHLDNSKNQKATHGEYINQHGKTGIVIIRANELEEIAAQSLSHA